MFRTGGVIEAGTIAAALAAAIASFCCDSECGRTVTVIIGRSLSHRAAMSALVIPQSNADRRAADPKQACNRATTE